MNNHIVACFGQFVAIEPNEIIELGNVLVEKKLKAGDYLIKAGQIPTYISMVDTGLFRRYIMEKDKERNVHFAATGEFVVDYPAYLQQCPTLYYIQALEDTVAYCLSRDFIEAKYEANPKWNLLGRKIAEDTIIKLQGQLESVSLSKPKERYEVFMNKFPHIYNRISQYHIASYLSIEPQSLSRIRRQHATS